MSGADDETRRFLSALRDAGGSLDTAPDAPVEGFDLRTIEHACALGLAVHQPGSAWATTDSVILTRRGRRRLGEGLPLTWFERFGRYLRGWRSRGAGAPHATPAHDQPARWTPPRSAP